MRLLYLLNMLSSLNKDIIIFIIIIIIIIIIINIIIMGFFSYAQGQLTIRSRIRPNFELIQALIPAGIKRILSKTFEKT